MICRKPRKSFQQKKYKKPQEKKKYNEQVFIRYYFFDSKKTDKIQDVKISIENTQKIFKKLREIYGEEYVYDYRLYRNDNYELTAYQEGSNYCKKITEIKLKDDTLSDNIMVCLLKSEKVPNDVFPCKQNYDEVIDVIDTVFKINSNIRILFRSKYNDKIPYQDIKKIEELGIENDINKCNKFWIELIVQASSKSNTNNVLNIINTINDILTDSD